MALGCCWGAVGVGRGCGLGAWVCKPAPRRAPRPCPEPASSQRAPGVESWGGAGTPGLCALTWLLLQDFLGLLHILPPPCWAFLSSSSLPPWLSGHVRGWGALSQGSGHRGKEGQGWGAAWALLVPADFKTQDLDETSFEVSPLQFPF